MSEARTTLERSKWFTGTKLTRGKFVSFVSSVDNSSENIPEVILTICMCCMS